MSEAKYANDLNKFMLERGWIEDRCCSCGRIFFSKKTNRPNLSVCSWRKCNEEASLFHSFPKRKKILSPRQINEKLRQYFDSEGFSSTEPLNIANAKGKTDLVIAGVQMFDDVIHRNQEIMSGDMFVSQPCVRMQFQSQVESSEGTSTSFVNVCTEKMGGKFSEHLQSVDHWFAVLSKLGLYMNDFTVVVRNSENDWGTGKFSSFDLFFSYGGLELGDASYFLIPQSGRSDITISDIGFGLERIVWAVNKTDSYFDTLIPWTATGAREMFDSFRTMTLLVMCGVRPSNKGPGLQFRRFAKVLSDKYYGFDVNDIVSYYFAYWNQFIKTSVSRESAVRIARLEIERFVNLKIHATLNISPPRNETSEEYLERLVYTGSTEMCKLRKAIKTCKT